MKKVVTLTLVLVLLFSAVAGTHFVKKARAETITVPDDYATIQEAINAAAEGDTVFVRKGTYEETTLKINKALSLISEDAESTQINLDPPHYTSPPNVLNQTYSWFGPSITVDADDFKLEGFTIKTPSVVNTAGGGISITGNRIRIVDNSITTLLSVNGSYSHIADDTFSKTVSTYGSYSNITKNTFLYGLLAYGSYHNISINYFAGSDVPGIYLEGSLCLIYGNNVTDNSGVGSIYVSGNENMVARNFVDGSIDGVKIDGSDNIIYANIITNNKKGLVIDLRSSSADGISEDSQVTRSVSNTFYANHVANNQLGVGLFSFADTNLTSIFYHNNLINNIFQVNAVYSRYGNAHFDNGREGNYWSDYTGTDADGDGIGDTPYVIDDNRLDRYPLTAPFDILSVTVELPEWASSLQSPSPCPSIEPDSASSPLTALVVALVITATVEGIGLLIYFKKRKR